VEIENNLLHHNIGIQPPNIHPELHNGHLAALPLEAEYQPQNQIAVNNQGHQILLALPWPGINIGVIVKLNSHHRLAIPQETFHIWLGEVAWLRAALKSEPLCLDYPGWGYIRLCNLSEEMKSKYLEAGVFTFYNHPPLLRLPSLAEALPNRSELAPGAHLLRWVARWNKGSETPASLLPGFQEFITKTPTRISPAVLQAFASQVPMKVFYHKYILNIEALKALNINLLLLTESGLVSPQDFSIYIENFYTPITQYAEQWGKLIGALEYRASPGNPQLGVNLVGHTSLLAFDNDTFYNTLETGGLVLEQSGEAITAVLKHWGEL